MSKKVKILLLASTAIFLNSCVSFVKPGISKVKKVAIISMQANKGIYGIHYVSGDRRRVDSITTAVSQIEGQKEAGNPFVSQLLLKAKEQFTKQLRMLPGDFEVISGSEVTDNPAYKEFIENQYKFFGGELAKGLQKYNRQTLGGYQTIPNVKSFFRAKDNHPGRKALAKLAADLGVDAVALIDMDIYYHVTSELLGGGFADAAVDTLVFIYGKEGEEVMGGFIPPQRKGPLVMAAWSVLLDKNTYPLFETAIVKSYEKMGKMASKEMKK